MDRGSPIYLCFLDAIKVFDRMNYWKLFNKLLVRGTPVILLIYWYTIQELTVKLGNSFLYHLRLPMVFDNEGSCLPTCIISTQMISVPTFVIQVLASTYMMGASTH